MEATVNGVRIAYDDTGETELPCLLLVHGFPLDRRMWREQLAGLRGSARVVAPDLRGFGESDAPPGPLTMEQHADDLAALLDELGIERAIVGGLSMGGYVAFALWRRHAQRVAGLVLMDTRADPDRPEGRAQRSERIASVRADGVRPLAEAQVEGVLGASSLQNEGLRRHALEIMLAQPAEGVIGALEGLRDRADSRGLLGGITVPTLVVGGEEDALTPPDVMAELAGRIAGAELLIAPRAGHLAPLENPAVVNAALAAFVRRAMRP